MEVNVITAPVISAAASQAPTWTALVIKDCKDTLKALGICYTCNKTNQTQTRTSYSGEQKREFSCYNCDKRGHMARDCRLPKKNRGTTAPMSREIKKICQEMMVQGNKKPGDFE